MHIPVLLEPFLELCFPESGQIFVDGTFGLGGHSQALLRRHSSIKICFGLDQDAEILDLGLQTCTDQRIIKIHARASTLPMVLAKHNVSAIDGFFLDLGVSSFQLDTSKRGFSFSRSGPLDMRMDQTAYFSAKDIVNSWAEEELSQIFFSFGEERFSKNVARSIVSYRQKKPFETTEELADLIKKTVPLRFQQVHIHPATRIFQALRMAVNDELNELSKALDAALSLLNPEGRISVISFHSLEDRIVKKKFSEAAKGCLCPPKFPVCVCNKKPTIEILTKKPIIADLQEISNNPRARSAKLRVGKRLQNDI